MEHGGEAPTLDNRGLAKNRIEALADGIFAVAMTLLVLDIKSPVNLRIDTTAGLIEYLATLEHSFAMYAISFVVLAIFWIAHHVLFHYIRHVDRRLLWMNMAFLLLVTFVPFSTDLLGDHGHLTLPVFVYGLNLIALGALLALQLRYLGAHPAMAAADLTPSAATEMRNEVWVYGAIPLLSMAISLYSPRIGMYSYLLLAIPTFAPSRLDRLLHPPERAKEHYPSEEP
jgi:TMEM175 potassium channel family protein